ncbi:AMP-dependent synthetase [Rhodococcus sp. ACPA1]|nr:AMP-dependent synthetase [Rhodococcus sp. ACPA1]
MASSVRWGETVMRSIVRGHPSLVYKDRPRSIIAALTESRRWADRPFIRHGSKVVSFAEHERMVRQFAHFLRATGVSSGDRVGIFAVNSPEWVAMFFAILEVGGIVVPCNGWWSAEEMANGCRTVSPVLVITDEKRADRVPAGVRHLLLPHANDDLPLEHLTLQSQAVEQADENAPAVILFTAGTTDFPKGALLSHRALVANLQNLLVVSRKLPHQIPDDNPPSVALVGLPLFHIGAIQLILFPLMTGSEIVFLDGRFDAGNVLSLIESHAVTMFSGVPTMMERLLAHENIAHHDLTSLRTVVLGGSPVDDALLERIRGAFPATSRGVGQTYGLTEAGGVVSTGVGSDIAQHPGSSGRLAPVVEIKVEQPDASGSGELLVRSPSGMDGYWGIAGDDTVDHEGWIRTGDLGHVDSERFLYVSGRAKDVIIRGGENVAAARVESVLREHHAVSEVAVIGLPDSDLGEIVAAVIQCTPSDQPMVAELEQFAAHRLAHFSVPSRWWIRHEPLPVNDSGKILKRQLLAEWLEEEADEAALSPAVAESGPAPRR